MNATQVVDLSTSNVAKYGAVSSYSTKNYPLTSNQVNEVGTGLGRLARWAFDNLARSWDSWWNKPSSEKMNWQRQGQIFRGRLENIIRILSPALNSIRKSPNDPVALKRIEDIVSDSAYADLFVPHEREDLRDFQLRKFKNLGENFPTLQRGVITKLRRLLPLVFQNSKQGRKARQEKGRVLKNQ